MRKIVIITVVCALLGIRMFFVNQNIEVPVTKIYEKGEVVAIENNFFDKSNEIMDGYTVRVLDAWIVSARTYFEENNIPESLLGATEYLYMVKAEFVNEYNDYGEEQGIDLFKYILRGKDYILTADVIPFKAANTLEGMGFSLSKNKPPFEIIIPFAITEDIDVDYIRKAPPMLQVCVYPESKLIRTA